MPRRRRHERKLLGRTAWLALLFGGLTLALRAATGPAARLVSGGIVADSSGRGPHSTPPSASARAEGHETTDWRGGLMARLVLVLFIVATLAAFGMVGLGRLFETMQDAGRPPLTAEQTTKITPPPPNLQSDPVGDLARLRQTEDQLLSSYAWRDPAHTRARVPITRAMEVVTGKSLETAP